MGNGLLTRGYRYKFGKPAEPQTIDIFTARASFANQQGKAQQLENPRLSAKAFQVLCAIDSHLRSMFEHVGNYSNVCINQ